MSFQPVAGVPAWRKLYDAFHELPYGAEISHEDIKRVLNGAYKNWRGPIYRFTKEIEMNDQKTIRPLRNFGYTVVNPEEHAGLATKRVIRGRRHLIKGRRTALATDTSLLTDVQRLQLSGVQERLNRILNVVNKRTASAVEVPAVTTNLTDIDVRLKRIENALLRKKKVHSST